MSKERRFGTGFLTVKMPLKHEGKELTGALVLLPDDVETTLLEEMEPGEMDDILLPHLLDVTAYKASTVYFRIGIGLFAFLLCVVVFISELKRLGHNRLNQRILS